jgi:chemotaxis signal transduction protein
MAKLKPEQNNTLTNKTEINMAHKTNEQKLRSLIKNLHTIEVALLVERIETMMKLTLQDIEEKPESYDNFFVSHHAYVNLANKVINQLK